MSTKIRRFFLDAKEVFCFFCSITLKALAGGIFSELLLIFYYQNKLSASEFNELIYFSIELILKCSAILLTISILFSITLAIIKKSNNIENKFIDS